MCLMALRPAPCHSSSLVAPRRAHALTGAVHGTQHSSVLMQQNRGDRWSPTGPSFQVLLVHHILPALVHKLQLWVAPSVATLPLECESCCG